VKAPLRTKVLLGLAVPLALFAVIAGLTWYLQSTGTHRPLTPSERAVLVTAKDLFAMSSQPELYMQAEDSGEREDLLDGSATLTAEYQSEKPPMYVVSQVALEPSERAAKLTWQSLSIGGFMGIAVESKDVVLVNRDDLYAWGDESKSQLLTIDGKPVGHFLVIRKGTRVFMAIFSGVFFDEAAPLAALLTPKLEAMERLP